MFGIGLPLLPVKSFGFDLEDYATTYRSTRDAYQRSLLEFTLAKGSLDRTLAIAKSWEKACYRLNIGKSDQFLNVQGTLSGACNKDGQLPHSSGGPKTSDGSPKFGDQLSTLINLAPLTSRFPEGDIEDANTSYRAFRDTLRAQRRSAFIEAGMPMTIETIPNCVVQDEALNQSLRRQATLEEFHRTFREVRDAFLWAGENLELATGPYKAAMSAYQAAVAVYSVTSDCESTLARSPLDRTDPYDWENFQQR